MYNVFILSYKKSNLQEKKKYHYIIIWITGYMPWIKWPRADGGPTDTV